MNFFNYVLLLIFVSANLTAADTLPFWERTNQVGGSPTTSPHGSPTKKENTAYGAKLRLSPIKKPNAISQEAKDSCRNRLFEDHNADRKETLVLFVTAPHDQPNRGDTDYVQSVMRAIGNSKSPSIKTVYVKDNCQINSKNLYNVDDLYSSKTQEKLPVYQIEHNEKRKAAVENIINYVENIKKSPTILHLQLRAPETGCLFFEDDLDALKSKVDKLVITCHEWCHGQDNFRQQQMAFFKRAHHVIFLNQKDQQQAIDASELNMVCSTSSTSGSDLLKQHFDLAAYSSYSNITQTVCTSIKDKEANTLPNILVFGLIRPKKGFEEAVKLAQAIKMLDKSHPLYRARVIIAGKPNDRKLLEEIICDTYNFADNDKKEFKYHLENNLKNLKAHYKKNLFLSCLSEQQDALEPEKLDKIREKLQKDPDISCYKNGSPPAKRAYDNVKNCQPSLQDTEKFHIKGLLAWLLDNRETRQKYLPIDFHFNISDQELDRLAQECKYCLKIEDKGFANNSSSIINALHRLLIVFCNQGSLTSAEFLDQGKYSKAVVLVDNSNTAEMIENVISLMNNIEENNNEFHERINAIKCCIGNLFSDKKVANDHLELYDKLFQ